MKLNAWLQKISARSHRQVCCFFITGTDTGIGKTWVTVHLVQKFRKMGILAVALKPVCCGDREDSKKFYQACGGKMDLDVINPIHLPLPVAPGSQRHPAWRVMVRAMKDSVQKAKSAGARIILVEGAGGVLCPMDGTKTMRDFAAEWGAPVLVVAPDRLGVLNHSLLTLEALKLRRLKVEAVMLNRMPSRKKDLSSRSNARILEEWGGVDVLNVP